MIVFDWLFLEEDLSSKSDCVSNPMMEMDPISLENVMN